MNPAVEDEREAKNRRKALKAKARKERDRARPERRSAVAGNRGQGSNWIRRSTRLRIYQRDGWKCVWCGEAVIDGRELAKAPIGEPRRLATLDHFLARSRGGTNRPSNLVTACSTCNCERDHMSALEWAAKLEASHVVYSVVAPMRWGVAAILERALRALECPLPPAKGKDE